LRKYKAYADIRGVPWAGASNDRGVIFGDLGGYFFGNVRDKASNITWRYTTLCWPVIDCADDCALVLCALMSIAVDWLVIV